MLAATKSPASLKPDHGKRMRRKHARRFARWRLMRPVADHRPDVYGPGSRVARVQGRGQLFHPGGGSPRHKIAEVQGGGKILIRIVNDLDDQGLSIRAALGADLNLVRRVFHFGGQFQRLVILRNHPRDITGRLQPDLRRVQEQQPLVPIIVILAIRLQAVRGGADGQTAIAFDAKDGTGIGQGATLRVITRVELEYDHAMLGPIRQPIDGVNIAEGAGEIRARFELALKRAGTQARKRAPRRLPSSRLLPTMVTARKAMAQVPRAAAR